MTVDLDGRVVVITGAGNGLGRAHALSFAAAGARVVVNDLGGSADGQGGSEGPAHQVVDEIRAAGGTAVANTDNIASWDGAASLISQAVSEFGTLDVLVNNAGILRDKMLTSMSEADWDAVINVHLKGTFAPTRHAADFWRAQSKAGVAVDARVVNTTSPSGLFGAIGQANYGSAKSGIAGFTTIAAMELARYGVTVNAVAPTALTRLTEDIGPMQELAKVSDMAPEAVSPVVVWLGSRESREVTGRIFAVMGGTIAVVDGFAYGPEASQTERWKAEELGPVMADLVRRAAPAPDITGRRPTRSEA